MTMIMQIAEDCARQGAVPIRGQTCATGLVARVV